MLENYGGERFSQGKSGKSEAEVLIFSEKNKEYADKCRRGEEEKEKEEEEEEEKEKDRVAKCQIFYTE